MTKQELRQYVRMDAELKRLENRIAEIEAVIQSPKKAIISDMPKGGKPIDIADKVAKLMDLKAQYDAQWDRLIDERKRIEAAINSLDDPIERALMGYKYIEGYTWENVCVEINYSWRQVHRMHANALKNMA